MSADRRMSTRRRMLGAAVGVLTALMINIGPSRASGAGTILIYGPSLDTETPNEQTVAEGLGYVVTVASDTDWADMTTAEFAAYDALVIGDAGCEDSTDPLDTATSSRTTWSPAVTGNIAVSGFDPFAHDGDPTRQTTELVQNAVNFAAGQPGTGLFLAIACYTEGGAAPLTIMDQFGSITARELNANEMNILEPAHALTTGLTNEGLSNWGESTHTSFPSFPSSFEAVVVETDVSPAEAVLLANVPPTCQGKPATLFGGPAGDVIAGTAGPDVIASLDGKDVVRGGGGPDIICGGRGKDTLKGGGAKDTLLGEAGRDQLAGGGGKGDRCKGGPGKDSAKGNCERGKA